MLIALLDEEHVDHERCVDWFIETGMAGWATCPLTENGLLRILGHPRYLKAPGTPAAAGLLLRGLVATGAHRFWADDVSLLDDRVADIGAIGGSARVTDTNLLALAAFRGGVLVTLDRRLTATAVRDGNKHLHVIA